MGFMHELMYFETMLCIVFQKEAIQVKKRLALNMKALLIDNTCDKISQHKRKLK